MMNTIMYRSRSSFFMRETIFTRERKINIFEDFSYIWTNRYRKNTLKKSFFFGQFYVMVSGNKMLSSLICFIKILKVFTTRKCSRTPKKWNWKQLLWICSTWWTFRGRNFFSITNESPHNDECRDLHNSASNNF